MMIKYPVKPHPEDPQTAIEVWFIEVKGRSAVGEVALSNPVRLGWEPLIKIEHYHLGAEKILKEVEMRFDI